MQAMPEIKTPRIHPPIALFKDAPKNNPTTAHKIIIITDTTVLNFFIQSHSFVKFKFVELFSFFSLVQSYHTLEQKEILLLQAENERLGYVRTGS